MALSIPSKGLAQPHARAFDRRALFVRLSAALAVLAVCYRGRVQLVRLGIALRKTGPPYHATASSPLHRRGLGPLALLLGCVGLLWLFQPYTQRLRSARSLTSASAAWHSLHFEGLFTLSSTLGALEQPFTPVRFWQSFICALVALALFVVVRGFLRYKRA